MDTIKTARMVDAYIVSAFVSGGKGGNPAAVVLDADALNESEMLQIAAKIGLSETAFVSASKTEGFRLDFFTPNQRIAHCGHATIATFTLLAELERVREGETSKETVDGPRRIILKEGAAFMEQLAPTYSMPCDWVEDAGVTAADVVASLRLDETTLDPRLGPILVSTGNRFIIVGVRNGAVLQSIEPDFSAIKAISDTLDLIGYYVFTTDPHAADRDATTRMFAPRYAIEEEAATGMAAGPLACLLHDHLNVEKEVIVIEQGKFMKPASPSVITVELQTQSNKITGLTAGGRGRTVRKVKIAF